MALTTVLAKGTSGADSAAGLPHALGLTHANAVESLHAPQRQQETMIECRKRCTAKRVLLWHQRVEG